MPLAQALPPYTSMPISYLERPIKGAITIPMSPASKNNRPENRAENPSQAAGGILGEGKSPSELHQASVDHARALLEPFKRASDGHTFVQRSLSAIPDIVIGTTRIRADEICLLEIHQHGRRLPNPNFVLATNTDLGGNATIPDLAFTKLLHVLCDEIERVMPRGDQCAGIVIIGTRVVFYLITPARGHRGCFVSAPYISEPSEQPRTITNPEPTFVPPRAWR